MDRESTSTGAADALARQAAAIGRLAEDSGAFDAQAVFTGAQITGWWPPEREVRWRPADIEDLDARLLLGKGGAQVHLLSVRAQLGLRGRGYSAYSSSKGGLVMLIRQHASELAPYGITVNGIAPTVVQTEMARHWLENPETREQVLARIPLGRVADPQDVAGAAVFFAAPASRFVTGQVLYLDGGITASQ